MRKLLAAVLGLLLVVGQQNAQQPSSNITGMHVLGSAVADQFGNWSDPATSQVAASGSATVTLAFSAMQALDGTSINFLTTHTPLLISDNAASETVTPSVVNCSQNSGICSFTATFSNAHPNNFKVMSGTYGLQEAIDDQTGSGGQVTVTPNWRGTTTMIQNATGSTTVAILDLRTGGENFYAWSGSHYAIAWGVSSSGTVVPNTVAAFNQVTLLAGTVCSAPSLLNNTYTTTGLAWAAGPKLSLCVAGAEIAKATSSGVTLSSGDLSLPGNISLVSDSAGAVGDLTHRFTDIYTPAYHSGASAMTFFTSSGDGTVLTLDTGQGASNIATFTGGIIGNVLTLGGATPTVAGGKIGFGVTASVGSGTAGTAVTATTKGAGGGPTTAQTIVNYLNINIGGTTYWVPLMQ